MHDEQILTPQQRILIIGLIKESVGTIVNNTLEDIAAEKMLAIELDCKKDMEKFFKSKLEALSSDKLNDAVSEFLSKHIEKTESKLKRVDDMVTDIWNTQLAASYVNIINEMAKRLSAIEYETKVFRKQFADKMTQNFIEVVGDDELQDLYIKADLQLKDLETGLNISLSKASRLVNGQVQDVELRYQLKELCMAKISRMYGG
ncbi:MAG: hypothetical protein WCH21_06975 [Bacteroidota bacterium]